MPLSLFLVHAILGIGPQTENGWARLAVPGSHGPACHPRGWGL